MTVHDPPQLVTLQSWCLGMSVANMKKLLYQAAVEYPDCYFTKPEAVATSWLDRMADGLDCLPKPVRDFLSKKYLAWRGEINA